MPDAPAAPSSPTDVALIDACLDLIGEIGFTAATTREIAARAGVNEVTLFRRFTSKAELIAASLAHATTTLRTASVNATDDLEADLVAIARGYAEFAYRRPQLLVRVLAEVAGNTDLARAARELMADNADRIRQVFEHHIDAGRLRANDPDEAMVSFLGPILGAVSLGPGITVDRTVVDLDIAAHVRFFLVGRHP